MCGLGLPALERLHVEEQLEVECHDQIPPLLWALGLETLTLFLSLCLSLSALSLSHLSLSLSTYLSPAMSISRSLLISPPLIMYRNSWRLSATIKYRPCSEESSYLRLIDCCIIQL